MSILLMRAVAFFIGFMSWKKTQKLGHMLGLIWYNAVRVRRKTVLENLRTAFGDEPEQNRLIAAGCYSHLGICAMEFLKLRSMTDDNVRGHVHIHGMEQYEQAKAKNKGVIAVTAHIGNFDLLACAQALSGIPLGIVSRTLRRQGISRFWMETRKEKKLKIFPQSGAARDIVKWLNQGNVLGLTVDQRTLPKRGGIKAPFMGREVWTTTAPANLALKTGAALLPVRILRRKDGDHDVFIEPELSSSGIGEKEEQIAIWTRQLNDIVEKWVRDCPKQWLWLHRRFVDSA